MQVSGKLWLALAVVLVPLAFGQTAQAATKTPVTIYKTSFNLMTSPKSSKVKHRGKTYAKKVLWTTKKASYQGRVYYRLTDKKRNLGYIRSTALAKISKPKLHFKSDTIEQDSKFNPNTLTYTYTRLDKVHIKATSHVNTKVPGNYTVQYHVTDTAGYNFNVRRAIAVKQIKLTGIKNPNFTDPDFGIYQTSDAGSTLQLEPLFSFVPTVKHAVRWQSSDSRVASVNSNGKVSFNQDGVATIQASFAGQNFKTPVLVTSSSNLTFGKNDGSTVDYGAEHTWVNWTHVAGHTYVGQWATNGTDFTYLDGENESIEENPYDPQVDLYDLVGNFTPDSIFGSKRSIIVETKDNSGALHQYVGNY